MRKAAELLISELIHLFYTLKKGNGSPCPSPLVLLFAFPLHPPPPPPAKPQLKKSEKKKIKTSERVALRKWVTLESGGIKRDGDKRAVRVERIGRLRARRGSEEARRRR